MRTVSRSFFLCSIFFLFFISMMAQQSMYTKVYYDLHRNVQGYAVVNSTGGGYIIAGTYEPYAMIMKVNENGDLIWLKRFGNGVWYTDRFTSITKTHDNQYLVAGLMINSNSDLRMVLVKFTGSGDTVFTRQVNVLNNGNYEGVKSVEMTADHGFIICATRYLYVGSNDEINTCIIKTDSAGNLQWSKEFDLPGSHLYGNSVRQLNDGTYIVAGHYWSSVTPWYSVFFMRLNPSGTPVWTKSVVNIPNSNMFAWDAVETTSGIMTLMNNENGEPLLARFTVDGNPLPGWQYNCYTFTGIVQPSMPKFRKTTDGGFQFVSCGVGYNDLLIKTDDSGIFQGGDNLRLITSDVAETPEHGCFILGNGPIMGVSLAPTLNPQVGVIRTDPAFHLMNCGDTIAVSITPKTIALTDCNFTSGSQTVIEKTRIPVLDTTLSIFIGCVAVTGGQPEKTVIGDKLNICPNPAATQVNISTGQEQNLESVEIYNTGGQRVFYCGNTNDCEVTVPSGDLPRGLYFVRVMTRQGWLDGKLVVGR